jgi:hypothetical protein
MPRGQHSLSTSHVRCSLFNSKRDIPFLFVKSGVDQGDKYIAKYENAKQGKEDDEDFFARALGDEAVQLLLSIRRLSYRRFNRNGDKAPEGYQFNRLETDIEKIET